MTHLDFSCCDVNQAVFFRHEGHVVILVLVHVDDCTIVATSITFVTNLDKLCWLLGTKIKCNHEHCTIHLSQRLYIDFILCHYGLQDLKPISIPINMNIHLTTAQSPSTTMDITQMCDIPYHEAVRYLCHPDHLTFLDETWTYTLGSCEQNFLILEGYDGALALI